MGIEAIGQQFGINTAYRPFGNGHINDTYVSEDGKYVLQKINTYVFKNPAQLMANVFSVTEFLRDVILSEGGDPDRETLRFLKTVDGKEFLDTPEGAFRMDLLIHGVKTVEYADKTPDDLYEAGRSFGIFQRRLSGFPAEKLYETIPDFHHTVKRVENLKRAIEMDVMNRAGECLPEIEEALVLSQYAGTIVNGIEDGSIPLCVTHNDTKINNVLFDNETNQAICVIDLDTVMPGSRLYDYGDALRCGACTADEDETDLSKVKFSMENFRAFTRGYLSEMKDELSEREKELLVFSIKLMTYECGIRFLTDYLEGDVYFKTSRPGQNLDRARTHFELIRDLELHEEEMQAYIAEVSCGYNC